MGIASFFKNLFGDSEEQNQPQPESAKQPVNQQEEKPAMFCFQCQETAKNTGCTVKGVCGKDGETANLQDLLIHVMKGIAVYGEKADELGVSVEETGDFLCKGLFTTITNANFDPERFNALIQEGFQVRDSIKADFEAAYQKKMAPLLPMRFRMPPLGPVMLPLSLKKRKQSAFWPRKMKMYALYANF